MPDSELLTPDVFEKHVGTDFHLTGADEKIDASLKLVSVERLGEAPDGHREPFSLLFEGRDDQLLPQQTHALRHEGLGDVDIFLVPLGPTAGAMRYEAVFG